MRVSKAYHDALVTQRDETFAQLDAAEARVVELHGNVEALEDEYDRVRSELRQAKDDAAPSDMADDVVEVFSQALYEYLATIDVGLETVDLTDIQMDMVRSKLGRDFAFVLRHSASSVDTVLDQWQNALVAALQLKALESLTNTLTEAQAPACSDCGGSEGYCFCADSVECDDPDCECRKTCGDPTCDECYPVES